MLTHVLHPALCRARKAVILSAYGAVFGSIFALNPSSSETSVIPYSFSGERFANPIGKMPLVSAVHLIPESFSLRMIFKLISVTSGYPRINGSVVKQS